MAAELPDGLVLDTARSAVSSSGRFTPSSFFVHDEDTPCESSAPTAAAAGHPHAEAGASPTAHWQEEPDAKRRKLPEQGGAAAAPVACADLETPFAELHDATVVTAIQSTIMCIRNAACARQAPALHIPSAAVPDWPHCIPLLCLTGHPRTVGVLLTSQQRDTRRLLLPELEWLRMHHDITRLLESREISVGCLLREPAASVALPASLCTSGAYFRRDAACAQHRAFQDAVFRLRTEAVATVSLQLHLVQQWRQLATFIGGACSTGDGPARTSDSASVLPVIAEWRRAWLFDVQQPSTVDVPSSAASSQYETCRTAIIIEDPGTKTRGRCQCRFVDVDSGRDLASLPFMKARTLSSLAWLTEVGEVRDTGAASATQMAEPDQVQHQLQRAVSSAAANAVAQLDGGDTRMATYPASPLLSSSSTLPFAASQPHLSTLVLGAPLADLVVVSAQQEAAGLPATIASAWYPELTPLQRILRQLPRPLAALLPRTEPCRTLLDPQVQQHLLQLLADTEFAWIERRPAHECLDVLQRVVQSLAPSPTAGTSLPRAQILRWIMALAGIAYTYQQRCRDGRSALQPLRCAVDALRPLMLPALHGHAEALLLSVLLRRLGNAYRCQKPLQVAAAESSFLEALRIQQSLGDELEQASTLVLLGKLQVMAGLEQQGTLSLQQAVGLYERIPKVAPSRLSWARSTLVSVLRHQSGKLEHAIQLHEQVRLDPTLASDAWRRAKVLTERGFLLCQRAHEMESISSPPHPQAAATAQLRVQALHCARESCEQYTTLRQHPLFCEADLRRMQKLQAYLERKTTMSPLQ